MQRNNSFISIRHKSHAKRASLLLSLLALTLLLVACGWGANAAPTPAVKTYQSEGYQLSYPSSWKYTTPKSIVPQTKTVIFTSDSDPSITFTLSSSPPIPGISSDSSLNAALDFFKNQYQGYQDDNTVPSTASVGGETWQEAGGTGSKNGQQVKGVALVVQHPATSGNAFSIILTASTSTYDQVYTKTFKPMLDSFKFIS